MTEQDDEATTFEQNPLGNRQRLVPRASFLARQRAARHVEVVDEATAAIRGSMIMDVLTHDEALESGEDSHDSYDSHDEALLSGEHTIGDLALPAASAVMLPAMAIATPVPSISYGLPQAAAVMLLPREIDYSHAPAPVGAYPAVATPYYPPTESHNALPIASRRVRYVAVPAILSLALIVLGGAAIPADIEAHRPATHTTAAEEPAGSPRSSTRVHEPEAPPEIIEAAPAPRIVFAPRKHRRPGVAPLAKRLGKHRPVKVDASSALGTLRPRKAW